MKFSDAAAPDTEVEEFFARWECPAPRPRALPGKIIVEFGPPGTRGTIFQPEKGSNSNNAMVVSDGNETRASREGFLPAGTQVIYTGPAGTNFEYQGRTLTVLSRKLVELYVPEDDE
jgi:hypothetical protein